MELKKCPKCGELVDGLDVCPVCGAPIPKELEPVSPTIVSFEDLAEDKTIKVGNIKLSIWESLFIVVCNICLIAIGVNIIVGQVFWCQYVVAGTLGVYLLVATCCSKNLHSILTKYLVTVLVVNTILGAAHFINWALNNSDIGYSSAEMNWVFDYFIPINILIICGVNAVILFVRTDCIHTILLSSLLLFGQNAVQLVLMLLKLTATGLVPSILVWSSIGANILTLINLTVLYFAKYKDAVINKFRFWE